MKTHAKHMVSTGFRASRIARTARVSALLSAVLLALLPALVGCTREPFGEGPDAPDSGSRTEGMIQLDAAVPENELRTRADAFENTAVRELWVGVYDITTGNRVGAAHFTSWPSSPVTLPVLYYDQHPTVAIVGVANYANQQDWDGNALSDQLDAADTWNKFVDLNVRPTLVDGAPGVDPDQEQIMMGVLTDDTQQQRAFFKKSDDGKVCIVTANNPTGTIYPDDEECSFRVKLTGKIYGQMIDKIEGKKIQLQRLFAQVNVTVKSGDNNISVTNVSYRRGNMPLAVYLAERPTWAGTADEIKTWNTYKDNTPNFADTKMTASGGYITNSDSYQTDSENSWIAGNRDNTFSFAHYENKHWGVKIDNRTSNSHQEREAYTTNQNFEGLNVLDFLSHQYNNFASYFVVRMSVLDKQNNRSAIVEYVIHEGNINNVYGQEGELNLSNNGAAFYRGNDFSAFRNTNYNYTITVNGINDIVSNITTNNHHNGQSGTIWTADNINKNNAKTVEFIIHGPAHINGSSARSDSQLVMRFYIGRGPDTDPLDLILLPPGISSLEDLNNQYGLEGIYWPAIGPYTVYNPQKTEEIFNQCFKYRKKSWGDYSSFFENLDEIVVNGDARRWGGTFEFTFNPIDQSAHWNADAWKMGIYYFDPHEMYDDNTTAKTDAEFFTVNYDPDNCTAYYPNKVIHVAEWKPTEGTAAQLKTLNNLSDYTVRKYVTRYVEIDITAAHMASKNEFCKYYVRINGKDYPAVSDNPYKFQIPVTDINNVASYTVWAQSTNTNYYTDSEESSPQTITLTTPVWDFTANNSYIDIIKTTLNNDYTGTVKFDELTLNGGGSAVKGGSYKNDNDQDVYYVNVNGSGSNTKRYFLLKVYSDCTLKFEWSSSNNSDERYPIVEVGGNKSSFESAKSAGQKTIKTSEYKIENVNAGGTDVYIYSGDSGLYFYRFELSD